MEHIKFAYRPKNKIGKMYSNLKDKIPKEKKKDVVYEVQCKGCNKIYIGQTGQYVEKRMKEHSYDCKNTTKEGKTALADHSKGQKHNFDLEDPTIFHTETDRRRREKWENICITKKKNEVVNNKNDIKIMGTFYSAVIEKINIGSDNQHETSPRTG